MKPHQLETSSRPRIEPAPLLLLCQGCSTTFYQHLSGLFCDLCARELYEPDDWSNGPEREEQPEP